MPLNHEQLLASQHYTNPCMVLSGPGSGKTTVITKRVELLIKTYQVPPEQILVITFTKAAAAELQERFLYHMKTQKTAVTFGTFHAVFYQILRRENPDKKFRLLTENERLILFTEVLRKTHPDLEINSDIAFAILSELSYRINHQKSFDNSQYKQIDFQKAKDEFSKRKKQEEFLDFDDLLSETKTVLEKNPESLLYWQKRFGFLLIDEFQDINPIQYDIVRMLARPHNNLFIVGDDDQSIYAFRGAQPQIMLDFQKDYPDARVIHLSVNYRSQSEIVEASLKLIARNKNRYEKKLISHKGPGGEVKAIQFPSESAEWDFIIREMEKEYGETKKRNRIAILCRTHNGMNGILQALSDRRIPFYTQDTVSNLFRSEIAKPVFALLNFTGGNRKRENFLKFMNAPYHGIQREDLREVVNPEKMAEEMTAKGASKGRIEKVKRFLRQLKFLPQLKTPYAMINFYRKGIGYDSYVSDLAEKQGKEPKEYLDLLDQIQESAKEYPTVSLWYESIAEYTKRLEEGSGRKEKVPDEACILSTLHAAKGLEFDTVFIIDVTEKNIPHEKSILTDQPEEERRLFYVGMTRAIRKLFICTAKTKFGKETIPSRFIADASLPILHIETGTSSSAP